MSEPEPVFTTHHQRWLQLPFYVPDRLPVQPAGTALRKTTVPLRLHLRLKNRERVWNLADPHDRAEVYGDVIVEGEPADILEYIDGPSIAEIWDTHMILPRDVEAAWRPLIAAYREKNN